MNNKAGHKVQIPLPSLSKGAIQAQNEANTALFTPGELSASKTNKTTPKGIKTIMKGIYFEPDVLQRLIELQHEGQNVSKLVNKIVKQHLGLNNA